MWVKVTTTQPVLPGDPLLNHFWQLSPGGYRSWLCDVMWAKHIVFVPFHYEQWVKIFLTTQYYRFHMTVNPRKSVCGVFIERNLQKRKKEDINVVMYIS